MNNLIKDRQQAKTMCSDIVHLHENGYWPNHEIPYWITNSDNPVIRDLYEDGNICPGIENYVVYHLMRYFNEGEIK